MKNYFAALLAVLVLTGGIAAAEQPTDGGLKKPAHAAASSGEAFARAMIEHGKPSEKDLAVLMPLTGTWDYLASLWTTPGDAPQQSTGVVTNEMVLDNHFLSSKNLGSLNVGGQQMPFESQELIGYDAAKRAYSFLWADSVAAGVMTGSGTYDGKKRVLNEKGRFTNPLTGAEQGFRAELAFTDGSSYRRTIFAVDASGRESKLMEFDYNRRK